MANQYGLDTHYFKKNLERILRDIDCYTPSEMKTALESLAGAVRKIPNQNAYTTKPAESLAGIALRELGDESRWVEIAKLNEEMFPDMRRSDYYPCGAVIELPL
jgi:nucleoid-associated protein YgaU